MIMLPDPVPNLRPHRDRRLIKSNIPFAGLPEQLGSLLLPLLLERRARSTSWQQGQLLMSRPG